MAATSNYLEIYTPKCMRRSNNACWCCPLVLITSTLLTIVFMNSSKTPKVTCDTTPLVLHDGNRKLSELRHNLRDIRDIRDNSSLTPSMYPAPDLGIYVYAAYYDGRQVPHRIHVFGIHRNDTRPDNFRCEFSSMNGVAWQVAASWHQIDREWPLYNRYFAFIMTCFLPDNNLHVSDNMRLLPPSGTTTIDIPIHHPWAVHSARQPIAICVKPMTGQFTVSRVVEWVELHLAAGYRNFIMYDTDLQGASKFVLDYYQSLGLVTVIRFPYLSAILEMAERKVTLEGHLRYALYQQVYLMALHDCLYRFQPSYTYLAMVDIDEIILPFHDVTITDVLRRAEQHAPEAASYMFYTYWHFREFSEPTPEIPEALYMQKTAWAPTATLDQPKSFVNTDRTLTVNWHGVMLATNGTDVSRYLLPDWEYAGVHHFRDGTCADHFHELCPNMTSAKISRNEITRHRHITEKNVLRVLNHLQL